MSLQQNRNMAMRVEWLEGPPPKPTILGKSKTATVPLEKLLGLQTAGQQRGRLLGTTSRCTRTTGALRDKQSE